MKAEISKTFTLIFQSSSGVSIESLEYIDDDDWVVFEQGTEVEILREIPAGRFGAMKAYVIFDPVSLESLTVSEIFLKILE